MGVHGFTKMVKPEEVTLKDLSNQVLAVDGSLELYRALLGMPSIKGLSAFGKTTLHVSVLLSNIIKYRLHKIETIWVFDYDPEKLQNSECHNPLKLLELEERRKKREVALKKIKKLKEDIKKKHPDSINDLFSDSDTDSDKDIEVIVNCKEKSKTIVENKIEIQKQEKIAFVLESWMVNDIKLMLNLLDIKWVEAPKGVEAECLASRLTHGDMSEADAVLSSDADALLFGATTLIKKNTRTKKYDRFYLEDILEDKNITQEQLIKVGIVLGTDMYKDKKKKLFYRIGPKTAIAKVKSGELDKAFKDKDVKKAIDHFKEICPIDNLEWHNENEESFSSKKKANILIDWLVNTKKFNRLRITTQVKKIIKL
jgi:5'-3' exonuclease